jgi:predicted RNA-binding protein with PUA-like domain
MAKKYWLMKSEPDVYSIDDLERDGSTAWEGVRNFKARNNLKAMEVGDEVLFYHSNANPPGVAGVARVRRTAYPDPSQFDRKSDYHDPKSDPESPKWYLVDVEFVAKAKTLVSLPEIKEDAELADMELVRYGRLSVQSVTKAEFDRVKRKAGIR